MKKHTIYYIVAAILLTSCSLFDELGGFQEFIPEGPFPSGQNYDSVVVIVGTSADHVYGGINSYPGRTAYVFNPNFPPNSVDYVIELRAILTPERDSGDSLFVLSTFSKGDTLSISTSVIDTTFHPGPDSIVEHIPQYNPERKRWRVATHRVTRLHTINGVPVRE